MLRHFDPPFSSKLGRMYSFDPPFFLPLQRFELAGGAEPLYPKPDYVNENIHNFGLADFWLRCSNDGKCCYKLLYMTTLRNVKLGAFLARIFF